jgi:tRNA(Ile)-lysidine synthase
MAPSPELVDRFRADLDELIAPGERLGIAVSGGPDSMALLLLAAAARPGLVEAATVDHALRPESRAEAEMVADICGRLKVPHQILTVEWQGKPATAIQERAREARYRLLTTWVRERGLTALAAAHHLDDQAETLVMRLLRGAGVRGLAGMRRAAPAPGDDLPLIRPLLSWRHSELEEVCRAAGITPVADPSNADEQFERVRVRRALSEAKWLDPEALALSADYLSEADSALHWATSREWDRAVTATDGEIVYRPDDAPREILRRIARRAVLRLAREGQGEDLRGRELDRLLSALRSGRTTTLRGVLCSGGGEWRFIPAPNRTRRGTNSR